MIFIRYENWKSYLKYYPVTTIILLANLAMFLFISIDGGSRNLLTLIEYGAIYTGQPGDEFWRYFTAMFLHIGFDHLLFNCFAILVFAPPLERLLGWWRYLLLYLGSGVVGNWLSLYFYNRDLEGPGTVSAGASGAIYGIYGAFLFIALFQRHLMDEGSRKTLYSLLIIGIIFSFAMTNVNWMGHLGGLVSGFVIYRLLTYKPVK